jgi:hypothetical protein
MLIIETVEEFDNVIANHAATEFLVIPLFCDTKAHPAVNPLSVLFVFSDKESFALTFNHNDAQKLPLSCLDQLVEIWNAWPGTVYTPFKSVLLHIMHNLRGVIDLAAVEHLEGKEVHSVERMYSGIIQRMRQRFDKYQNVSRSIPIMKLMEFYEEYAKFLWAISKKHPKGLEIVNDLIIPVCHLIESSGINVDLELFVQHFGESSKRLIRNGLVYTQHNPYTSAGRVTSRFGGINFAALNKSDGTRLAFTSRHERGMMVLIDWESFHLRLIANLIGYSAPKEPMHEYLGKQYFKTNQLTKEQYEEGKKITFTNLYSTKSTLDIPYFRQVRSYVDNLWQMIQTDGEIQTPSGHVLRLDLIEEPNPAKVFNYLLQWTETETAFRLIQKLEPVYTNNLSKIVLFTYDSVLIDFSLADGVDVLKRTVQILEDGGRYPVRMYRGKNYNDMKNVSNLVKTP